MGFKTRNKVDAQFSLSSMSDMVFLLLIFFMITSTLVTSSAYKVKLPSGNKARHKVESVDVAITSQGTFIVGHDEVEEAQLAAVIQATMNKNPEASLVVHGDEAAAHGDVVKVMKIAYENKYEFVIATSRQ